MFYYAFYTIVDPRALSSEDLRWLVDTCSAQSLSSAYLIAQYADTVPGLIDAAAAMVECYEKGDRVAYNACWNEYREWFHTLGRIRKILDLFEAMTPANQRVIKMEISLVERTIKHQDLMHRVLEEHGRM